MVQNYKEVGQKIPQEFREGVDAVNNLVEDLGKRGLLPNNIDEEKIWQKELADLDSSVNIIRHAAFQKDGKTSIGFNNLLTEINSDKFYDINRKQDIIVYEVLGAFQTSIYDYKNSSNRPKSRTPSGKIEAYRHAGILTPREIRILIFSYNLLPDKTKSLEDLSKEEGIEDIEDFKKRSELKLVWAINENRAHPYVGHSSIR
jgi:hypothetical protein